ncbi:hypothetical protein EFB08_20930 [Rufibacter latericius]|uniref:Uncharacterized protein n=1 Tax=Rufibacter latericius TaxID=2487040 RepID=A0A3M9MBM3_9BACT|nr:hypothetical protein EFB08_20930 [Rufibacter latericius]
MENLLKDYLLGIKLFLFYSFLSISFLASFQENQLKTAWEANPFGTAPLFHPQVRLMVYRVFFPMLK